MSAESRHLVPLDSPERRLGVLFGFDGSEHSLAALDYAAAEALRRDVPLTVVSAYAEPQLVTPTVLVNAEGPVDDEARDAARALLDVAREHLGEHPGQVDYRAEAGDPAAVLVELSAWSRVAVVGFRGRGGFLGRVLGSVSTALPPHAQCPTVVVRVPDDPAAADGPVVVGYDRSEHARSAVEVAAASALRTGSPLEILEVMPPTESFTNWFPELPLDHGAIHRRRLEMQTELDAEAARLRDAHPGLEVSASVEVGAADAEFAQRTRTASLTVLGSRGRGAVASTLLGSVSRKVLHHAEGPVMVVPV